MGFIFLARLLSVLLLSNLATNPLPTDTQELLEEDERPWDCNTLVDAQPRGIACLHCNQPEAKKQADAIVDILAKSCVKNVAINYLIDGTFGYDEAMMRRHIEKLTEGDRQLHLQLFFINGAGQKFCSTPYSNGFLARMCPNAFDAALSGTELRPKIRRFAESRRAIVAYALSRGAKVYLAPVLEDEISNKNFYRLLATFRRAYSGLPVSWVRSTTLYDATFRNVRKELHDLGRDSFVITNDGVQVTPTRFAKVCGTSRKRICIHHSASRQGRTVGFSRPLPASKRDYKVPSNAEERALIRFLRNGR